MTQLANALLGGLGVGSIYALVALGFSFILKTTNSFNFAQGQLVPLGSLLTWTVYTLWGLPAALAAIGAVIITGLLGGVIERVAIFPLARRGENNTLLWLMATLGVASILTGLSTVIWGSEPLGVQNYFGDPVTHFGNAYIATPYILAFVSAIVFAVLIAIFQRRTRWGRTMRAIADNRGAVQLSGVNVLSYGFVAYGIGAALAGIAGFIIAPITYASSTGGFTFTILGFAALAMGGFGSQWGALIGGLIVGLVEQLAATYIGLTYQDFAVFVVLLVVLLIKPDGLFGGRAAREV
ncbi:MAG: inner-rane translocator [Subtercola sp.]|nr:inner-rane translocator [Subtercola sp.]